MNLTKLKDYNTADTIASIATFPAKSALGIIKVSGSRAMAITSRIFSPAKKKDIRKARTYSLHYGWIINRGQRTEDRKQKRKEEIIDEALVSIMRKPHSYTCEDVVEISSHGGTLVLNKILELVLRQGARLALPGEFSYRAFLNGRIDLLQAQSILNIIDAGSEDFLSAASSQLQGKASFSL
jgi:tRNA modification GTPase